MDYEYYGISREDYEKILSNRDDYFIDYWRKGRHFSRVKSKERGDSARIADKNIYANLKESFYGGDTSPGLQGVFYGYGRNDFIRVHIGNKYLLKIDFKSCFRHIARDEMLQILDSHRCRLALPLPGDMVKSMYFPYGYLQAGLSASNILSDLFFKYNFDKDINKMLHDGENELGVYSRYYDDLYISSNDKNLLRELQIMIRSRARDLGMPINNKKSFLRTLNGARIFTSTVVDGDIRVSRRIKNNIRAAEYQFGKIDRTDNQYESYLISLINKLQHIIHTEVHPNRKYEEKLDEYKEEYRRLKEDIAVEIGIIMLQ